MWVLGEWHLPSWPGQSTSQAHFLPIRNAAVKSQKSTLILAFYKVSQRGLPSRMSFAGEGSLGIIRIVQSSPDGHNVLSTFPANTGARQRPLHIHVHPDFCHLLNTEGQAEAFGKDQDSLTSSQDTAFALTIYFSIPSLQDTNLSIRQLLGAKTSDIIAKHMLKRDWKLCWQCYRGEKSTALGQNKQKKSKLVSNSHAIV